MEDLYKEHIDFKQNKLIRMIDSISDDTIENIFNESAESIECPLSPTSGIICLNLGQYLEYLIIKSFDNPNVDTMDQIYQLIIVLHTNKFTYNFNFDLCSLTTQYTKTDNQYYLQIIAYIVAYFPCQFNFSFFHQLLEECSLYIDNYFFQSILLDYLISPCTIDNDSKEIHYKNKDSDFITDSILQDIALDELLCVVEEIEILENLNNQGTLYIILIKLLNHPDLVDPITNVFHVDKISEYFIYEHYFYLGIIWEIVFHDIELFPLVYDSIIEHNELLFHLPADLKYNFYFDFIKSMEMYYHFNDIFFKYPDHIITEIIEEGYINFEITTFLYDELIDKA